MKKHFFSFSIALIFSLIIHAQDRLMVQSGNNGIYLKHTVAPKENYYAIGRLYNVPPKELAAFNSLDMNNGLQVGQTLMVPLAGYNFSQTQQTGMPVYYQVGTSEGLYRVSVKNNNVPIENLRIWNNLSTDNIHVGANLVIGFLKGGEVATAKAEGVNAKEVLVEKPAEEIKAVAEKPAATATKAQEEVAVKINPEAKPQTPVTTNNSAPSVSASPGNVPASGYFTETFKQQIQKFPARKESSVTSGIFKTSSGWQDGKYYLLIDGVDPGMIVKLINPVNSRFVYAKVLGGMSGIRQNQGYNIRMSNAAAAALGADGDKFTVTVNY